MPTIAQQMVKLGNAGTLEALYANLTGDASTNAWPKFKAALAGINASIAARKTTGWAEVSSEKRTPSPVILRISPTTWRQPV